MLVVRDVIQYSTKSPIEPEENECAKGFHGCEQVKYPAFQHWVSACEEVPQGQEDKADKEVGSPW